MIIYKAENLIDGKKYIGQTLYSLEERRYGHEKSNSNCILLRYAIHKYGKENFQWNILCECKDQDELNKKEIYYIEKFNTLTPNGYNLKTGGSGGKYSDKLKKKISEARKGKHYPKISEALIGHIGLRGENNPNFNNWSSRLPYNINYWTYDLRKSIRERDNYQCQFCGIKENGRKHSIHHIDYDKQNCDKKNLITLCQSHNSKANCNREKWQFCFEVLQEIKDTYKNKFIYK